MKKKKNLLVFVLIFLLFCFFITLAGAAIYVAGKKLDNSDDSANEGDDNDQNDEDADDGVDDAEEISSSVYAIANCKLYSVSENAAQEIVFVNNTNINCFDKKLFRGNYAVISPDYDSLIQQGVSGHDRYIIDVPNRVVREINFETDTTHTVLYNPVDETLYTYLADGGLYQGTFDDPLTTNIFVTDSVIYGRGGMFSEDFRMRLSPDGTKILIEDTFTSENADGSDFTSLKVVGTDGTLIYETRGSFAQFIDNDRLIYSSTDSMGGGGAGDIIVVNLENDQEEDLNLTSFAYHIDVTNEFILIDYFSADSELKVGDMHTVILDSSDYTQVDSMAKPLAYNMILDEGVTAGKKAIDCSGEWDSNSPYPCPFEGPFGFYEKSLDSYNLDTSTETQLVVFTDITQPRFTDL